MYGYLGNELPITKEYTKNHSVYGFIIIALTFQEMIAVVEKNTISIKTKVELWKNIGTTENPVKSSFDKTNSFNPAYSIISKIDNLTLVNNLGEIIGYGTYIVKDNKFKVIENLIDKIEIGLVEEVNGQLEFERNPTVTDDINPDTGDNIIINHPIELVQGEFNFFTNNVLSGNIPIKTALLNHYDKLYDDETKI